MCGSIGASGIVDAPECWGWRSISARALGAVAAVLATVSLLESFAIRWRFGVLGCAPTTTLPSTLGAASASRCGASRGAASLARVAEGAGSSGGADAMRKGLDSVDCDTAGRKVTTGAVAGRSTEVGAGSEGANVGVAADDASTSRLVGGSSELRILTRAGRVLALRAPVGPPSSPKTVTNSAVPNNSVATAGTSAEAILVQRPERRPASGPPLSIAPPWRRSALRPSPPLMTSGPTATNPNS